MRRQGPRTTPTTTDDRRRAPERGSTHHLDRFSAFSTIRQIWATKRGGGGRRSDAMRLRLLFSRGRAEMRGGRGRADSLGLRGLVRGDRVVGRGEARRNQLWGLGTGQQRIRSRDKASKPASQQDSDEGNKAPATQSLGHPTTCGVTGVGTPWDGFTRPTWRRT